MRSCCIVYRGRIAFLHIYGGYAAFVYGAARCFADDRRGLFYGDRRRNGRGQIHAHAADRRTSRADGGTGIGGRRESSREEQKGKGRGTYGTLSRQYPEHQLFEETVYEDIAFGPRNQGLTDENVAARVKEAMELVHLPDGYRDRSPFALSGGERRRVAIAGVLALAPRYLVLDEPAAGLDPRGREALLAMLTMLHRERGVTIVLVSHSMEDILRVADHMVILAGGRVIGEGEPRVLFQQDDLLARAALAAPHLLRLGRKLEAAGYPVEGSVTVEDMAQKILGKH